MLEVSRIQKRRLYSIALAVMTGFAIVACRAPVDTVQTQTATSTPTAAASTPSGAAVQTMTAPSGPSTASGLIVTTTPTSAPAVTTPPPSATNTPAPAQPSLLPDLQVYLTGGISIYAGSCIDSFADLTPIPPPLSLCVRNAGQGDAGPFVVGYGSATMPFDGLAAGGEICVPLQPIYFTKYVVDPDNRVRELDENNNYTIFPVPTQPPICTQPPPSP